jgi:hypothetical protein
MAQLQRRSFVDEEATSADGTLPIMISLLGFAHSGKSYSALELATGIQRVTGDEIHAIGTEGNALKMYAPPAGRFKFRHTRLAAPFGADSYHQAIEFLVEEKRARLILIDNMSYEHTGEGGLLDMRDRAMEERIKRARQRGDRRPDWKLEAAYSQPVWAEVKKPRTQLERYMESMRDEGIIFIMTFRADERYVPKKAADPDRDDTDDKKPEKAEPEHQWKVEGTSELPYISNLRWLLEHGADGRATFLARSKSERKMCKTPECFRALMTEGQQLSADLGEKIARICRSAGAKGSSARPSSPTTVQFRPSYSPKQGNVADADPPDVDAYLLWLHDQAVANATDARVSTAIDAHIKAVQDIYTTMLEHEAAE